jgi:hypothetical protein
MTNAIVPAGVPVVADSRADATAFRQGSLRWHASEAAVSRLARTARSVVWPRSARVANQESGFEV